MIILLVASIVCLSLIGPVFLEYLIKDNYFMAGISGLGLLLNSIYVANHILS